MRWDGEAVVVVVVVVGVDKIQVCEIVGESVMGTRLVDDTSESVCLRITKSIISKQPSSIRYHFVIFFHEGRNNGKKEKEKRKEHRAWKK